MLVDGNWDFVGRGTTTKLVKGDARCLSIAAASILAKVSRDRIMRAEADHHPGYDFDLNKGYPCPRHKARPGRPTARRRSTGAAGCSWSTCRGAAASGSSRSAASSRCTDD